MLVRYAGESINIACKWGYKDVEAGDTLSGKRMAFYHLKHFD